MLKDNEKTRLLARLRRIEGQVGGLVRMVDADKYCVDVLQQVAAVQGALAQAGKQLVRTHLETCVADAFESGQSGRQDRVIAELVDLFGKTSKRGPAG